MMIKKIFTVLLTICLLPLVGCHTSRTTNAFVVPDSFDTSKQYEITFWAKNDTNKNQVKVYQDAITEFESYYPNITVNLKLYTDYGRIYNDVITNISIGTTPDICITYPDHIATYITGSDVVVPLDELMTNVSYGLGGSDVLFNSVGLDEIVPQYLSEGIVSEQQYALPYMRSTEALYINKDFVEKLGYTIPEVVTWDFIWEVSEKACEKNPDGTYALNGQNVMIPFIYKSTDNMMIQYLEQMGADYADDAGNILLFNDTTSDFLKTVSSHVPSGAFSTFKISSYPANFLDAGQCVFAIDSTAGSTWMGSEAPLSDISDENRVSFETVVKPVPQVDTNNIKMISQGPSICIFNKEDNQQVLASWLFAQFLLTDSVQIAYAQTEGYVPVTTSAQNNDVYQTYLHTDNSEDALYYKVKLDATQMLLDHIDHTFVTAVFNGSASVRNAAGQLIEETVKSTKRSVTIDDAYLENLYSTTKSLYHLDQIERQMNQSNVGTLGPLPTGSKVLLGTLVATWVCIGLYFVKHRKSI